MTLENENELVIEGHIIRWFHPSLAWLLWVKLPGPVKIMENPTRRIREAKFKGYTTSRTGVPLVSIVYSGDDKPTTITGWVSIALDDSAMPFYKKLCGILSEGDALISSADNYPIDITNGYGFD